jgi:adenine/guanine phosphoribosyltransferase-like PRPP-binding protein
MRRSIDDATDDAPADDDRPRVSWAVAIADDYDDAQARVVVTLEEVGAPGAGIVAHLGPAVARRLRTALRDALREIGADPGA